MVPRIQLAVAIVVTCNVIGCQRPERPSPPPPVAPATPDEAFVSKAGNFKVSIRGKPTEKEQSLPRGTPVFYYIWEREGTAFVIAYSNHSAAETENEERLQELIDIFLNGSLRAQNAKVSQESRVKVANRYVGRDIMASYTTNPSTKLRGRLFFVGQRLYRLMVTGTQEVVEGEEVNRFFETFEVLE